MNNHNAGKGFFTLNLTLTGDNKFYSPHPYVVKDNETILTLDNDGEFEITATSTQKVNVVLVGAGESAVKVAHGAAGDMVEKELELNSGKYVVNIGNPELNGKTSLGLIDNGMCFMFLSARGGAEMKRLMISKRFLICSQKQYDAVSASGGFAVGIKIQDSPVGPGVFTDISERGYPRVDQITVTNFLTEEGAEYGDYFAWIKKKAEKNAKEENKLAKFFYEHNSVFYSEGTGPIPEAKFGQYYSTPLVWELMFLTTQASNDKIFEQQT